MIKNPDWDMREDIEYLPHQLEGINLLVERRRQILADDPGAGKSLQCLAACKELSAKRILVVSVSGSVRDTWPTEISKHTTATYRLVDPQNRKASLADVEENFLLIHYQAFLREGALLEKYNPDVIIFDEGHALINRGAKTTKEAIRFARVMSSKAVFIVTGSPVINGADDYWSLLRILDPTNPELRSYWNWVYEWLQTTKVNYGKKTYGVTLIGPPKDEEKFRRYLSKYVIRRSYSPDVERIVEVDLVSLSGTYRTVYDSMAKNMFFEHPVTGEVHNATNRLSQITKLRQLAIGYELLDDDLPPLMSPKADRLIQRIQEAPKKVLVFSFFKRALICMQKRLELEGIQSVILSGGVSVHERRLAVKEFRENPEIIVLLAQISIGGTSFTLLDATTLATLDPNWAPENDEQAFRRSWRIGQEDVVRVWELTADKSIETYIRRKIRDPKISLTKSIVDALEAQEILE